MNRRPKVSARRIPQALNLNQPFPIYPSDFLAEVGALTTEEIGSYILILISLWHTRSLPEFRVQIVSRLDDDAWSKHAPSILGMLQLNAEGQWFSPGLEQARSMRGASGGAR